MSLIDLLNKKEYWLNYLELKKNYSHLPNKILNNYEDFIKEEKYKIIANEIISGNYVFSIPKKVSIGKNGTNKKRVVYIFKEEETMILKLLNNLLYNYDYLFSDNLYSFRQNSGVKKALDDLFRKNNINNLYGYKADITNYFNSINIDNVISTLEKDLNDKKLYDLFCSILKNDLVDDCGNIIKEKKGAMAGVPISSFLANYYLKDMDKYFYDNNVIYARYADDIIIFSKTKEELDKNIKYLKDYLSKKELSINPSKEYLINPKDEFEFLGFSYINGKIDLSKNTFKKIKGKIRRTARGLRRWMIKKDASIEVTLKAMNRKFNRKFYGKNELDLTWKYWFFPLINTSKTLKEVDKYMQDEQRYVATGKHNKTNYKKVSYSFLKQCNYRPLVNEYYKDLNKE